MSYLPSINIELNTLSDIQYIVTENAKLVAGKIINGFNSGHHSFSIIGTYGTGKSSFILALEEDLKTGNNAIIKQNIFRQTDFYFLNIVGDYTSLGSLLRNKLNSKTEDPLTSLNSFYQSLQKEDKFLVIVVDEFGKILEYASENNPDKEIYFLQRLSEYVNVPSRNIILLTTLHQNFGSYASNLDEVQKKEWKKVKGRFQEIVFAEPVEQLLTLTAEKLLIERKPSLNDNKLIKPLYDLGRRSKIISENLSFYTASLLYPLDPISAVCLTIATQRYGQQERSLFSFLSSEGDDSVKAFTPTDNITYNVARVYDYITYYFYSAITETNSDSMGWRAINVAIERIEGSNLDNKQIQECLKLIKTIGLINIFFNGITLDFDFLNVYGKYALGLNEVKDYVILLESQKIIRFANYKGQYILYEGTDLDLEGELYKAASIVPVPTLSIEEIAPYIKQKAAIASASYYKTGTPRYFEYCIFNEPNYMEPQGEIDGFIQLIFPLSDIEQDVKMMSGTTTSGPSIYGYFKNTEKLIKYLYEIKKIQYVIDNVAFDDRVAKQELENQKNYEIQQLNETINPSFTTSSQDIEWYFKGEKISVKSMRDFNKLLSHVCDVIYYDTPIIRNELINRQKLSSAISLARVNLLDAMLNRSGEKDFGITSFGPERTIYFTLFRDSGIHKKDNNDNWILGAPTSTDFKSLWDASIQFLESASEKPRKLSDFAKSLSMPPMKLKKGVIDFWIPIFLFINQQDFALYNGNTFVLNINREVFELLQKKIGEFSIKTFKFKGVRLEFFKRYRQFLKKDEMIAPSSSSLIETVKPFFHFYRGLNKYAKTTRKFDNVYTAKFRDVLSNAQDPSKTFFEDLPVAFGYKEFNSDVFLQQYLELIHRAVRELNMCYDNLIDRIEEKIIQHLGLPSEFEAYKHILENRYQSIDQRILTPKTRAFLDRILSPSESKREFIEKVSIVINDKRLEELKDSEEPMLVTQMLYVLSELERMSNLVDFKDDDATAEAFSFELGSNKGNFSRSQTFRLPKTKSKIANEISHRIQKVLTDDEELNICILLKLLKEKVK